MRSRSLAPRLLVSCRKRGEVERELSQIFLRLELGDRLLRSLERGWVVRIPILRVMERNRLAVHLNSRKGYFSSQNFGPHLIISWGSFQRNFR
jgi:hypothetical protein